MLSRKDATHIIRLLSQAERAIEEHAVEQSWRADAMHAIKERLMEMYHRNQHANALDTLSAIRAARADLAGRVERADAQPLRPAAAVRRAN